MFHKTISIGAIVGALIFSAAAPSALAAELDVSKMPSRDRAPKAGHTLLISRAQLKYGLDRNYMRRWLDRPLFVDRSLRVEDRQTQIALGSFKKIAQIVTTYDLDALAFFPETSGRHAAFDLADRAGVEGFRLWPEFVIMDMPFTKEDVVRAAKDCENVYRIDGKIPIGSYKADRWPNDKWKSTLAALRDAQGDTFYFIADCSIPAGRGWISWYYEVQAGATSLDEARAAIVPYLRERLDVCDGICFSGVSMLRTPDRKFFAPAYSDFLIPMMLEALDAPAYRDKFLGLSAKVGYYQPATGSRQDEDGTKTLRDSLTIAMAANPDFVSLPEWDEVNENTSVRPTVMNSFSTRRIVRYFARRSKGLAPAPNPGDDAAIPNLILSHRKTVGLGDEMEFELVNVPDGSATEPYQAQLTLKDLDGREVRRFEAVTFDPTKLDERRWAIPSEDFAKTHVLRPSLRVEKPGAEPMVFEDGLHSVQLRATWNWDLKWVKQPLRDLIRVKSASLELVDDNDSLAPGEVLLKGAFDCDEELASVEIVEDGDVAWALDKTNEFFRDRARDALILIEYRCPRRKNVAGRISLEGAKARAWRVGTYHQAPKEWGYAEGQSVDIQSKLDWRLRTVFLSLEKAEAEKGTLKIDTNLFKLDVPLAKILENGIYSETYEDGLTLTVARFDKQPDHPPHLNEKRVAFTARLRPEIDTAVLRLRAVAKSGRTWRGRPIALPATRSGKTVKTVVHSDAKRGPATVEIDAARVPDLNYEFTKKYGSILHTKAGRPFWGHLGGAADVATARGGGDTGAKGTPFTLGKENFPKDATKFAPDWVEEDGALCLKFDGKGTHIVLPLGALPRRAGFHMTFEIKPTSTKPQVLFAHHGHYIGSLVVNLDDGKLSGFYTAANTTPGEEKPLVTYDLDPGLTLPPGEWSKVEVICDKATIRFRVNGEESPRLEAPGLGFNGAMSSFGGFGAGDKARPFFGKPGWFEGYLRALRIVHSPEL